MTRLCWWIAPRLLSIDRGLHRCFVLIVIFSERRFELFNEVLAKWEGWVACSLESSSPRVFCAWPITLAFARPVFRQGRKGELLPLLHWSRNDFDRHSSSTLNERYPRATKLPTKRTEADRRLQLRKREERNHIDIRSTRGGVSLRPSPLHQITSTAGKNYTGLLDASKTHFYGPRSGLIGVLAYI